MLKSDFKTDAAQLKPWFYPDAQNLYSVQFLWKEWM